MDATVTRTEQLVYALACELCSAFGLSLFSRHDVERW